MLASLIGVVSIWKHLGKIIEKNLHFLVSFSAGVFLYITYNLIMEILLEASTVQMGISWISAGVLAVWLIFKLLPSFHHHHDDETDDCEHSALDARRIIFGDAIHNVGDGLLLVTSFAVSTSLGIAATMSIFIHEIIQELSEFFVLRQAGYSTKKALLINFLASATILIGSLGGFFLLHYFKFIEVPLLGLAAGSFLVVVMQDLIPHSIKTSTTKMHIIKHLLWFTFGIIIMLGLSKITVD